jgi:hypothetical protein
MKRLRGLLRRYWVISLTFFVLAAVYLVQSATVVPDAATLERYDLTVSEVHVLSLTIALPYVLIWVVALFGYLWLRSYTSFLGKGKDAPGFKTLANGVFLLTLWLPVSTVSSNLASSYYGDHPASTAWLIRLVTYLNILLLLPAFYQLNRGANRLLSTTRTKRRGMSQVQTVLYIVFAVLYVFVTFTDDARQVAIGTTTHATYYLPDWLTLLTVVIPRVCMWYLGFSAVASMILYRKEVKGAIYKEALRFVAFGMAGVVCVGILLRVIQSLTSVINALSLTLLLLLVYGLLTIMAIAYAVLAKGAERLQKIEES